MDLTTQIGLATGGRKNMFVLVCVYA